MVGPSISRQKYDLQRAVRRYTTSYYYVIYRLGYIQGENRNLVLIIMGEIRREDPKIVSVFNFISISFLV